MNIRQQKYKANRIAGMTQYNAARAAGYSENMAKSACRIEKLVKVSIQDALEQAGLTDKFMAEQLTKWAAGKNGKIAMTALRLAADLKGQIRQKHEHTGKDGEKLPEMNNITYVITTDETKAGIRGVVHSESGGSRMDSEQEV